MQDAGLQVNFYEFAEGRTSIVARLEGSGAKAPICFGGHVRTVPGPDWVRAELDDWLAAAAIDRGKLFRRVNKVGRIWGDGMTVKAVWHIVKESAKRIGVAKLAPHDLRRTCARLCHASGGE